MIPAQPDWSAVTAEALRTDAGLARVFAAMGFTRHVAGATRDTFAFCWTPAYATCPASSPHRAIYAGNNRHRRDAPVHGIGDGHGIYLVDAATGEWRSAAGDQRGDDLPSLGMLRWGCRYGQAASRIARTIGIRIPAKPVAADLRAEMFRGADAIIAAEVAHAA